MIFIQAQAEDNRSADPFVLNGVVVGAGHNDTRQSQARASQVRLHGELQLFGATEIATYRDLVSFEVRTAQADSAGRPAPILVTVLASDLERDSIPGLVAKVRADAALIGRTFDEDAVTSDLEAWWGSPKVQRGWLRRLGRYFAHQFKRVFATQPKA